MWAALDAYWEEKNNERRHIAELVRGATQRLWNIQVDGKYKIDDACDFWPMPWDDKRVTAEQIVKKIDSLSDEERDIMAQDFINRIKNGK